MEKSSILYILESNDVKKEDIKLFNQKLKDKSFTIDDCDKLLVKLGYEKIFTNDYDDDLDEDYNYSTNYEQKQRKKTLEE